MGFRDKQKLLALNFEYTRRNGRSISARLLLFLIFNFKKIGCKFEINIADLPSSAKLPKATRHISVRAAFWQ